MRLTEKYRESIKRHFTALFDGKIYLFGSRVDDEKRGGDIDLYLAVKSKDNLAKRKIKFLTQLKREIGEQKIDVVFNRDPNRLIEKRAVSEGVEL